jgi:hypothetical protein
MNALCLLYVCLVLLVGPVLTNDEKISPVRYGICSWSMSNHSEISFGWIKDKIFGKCQHSLEQLEWHNHKCVSADFSKPLPSSPISMPLVSASPSHACSDLTNNAMKENSKKSSQSVMMRNTVVLAKRGECSFMTKARNIEAVGAWAAIIIDHASENSEPMPMGCDASPPVELNLVSMMIGANNITDELWDRATSSAKECDNSQTAHTICYRLGNIEMEHTQMKKVGEQAFDGTSLSSYVMIIILLMLTFWAFYQHQSRIQVGWKVHLLDIMPPVVFMFVVLCIISTMRSVTTQRMLLVPSHMSGYGFYMDNAAEGGGGGGGAGTKDGHLKGDSADQGTTIQNFNHRENDEIILHFLAENVKHHGLFHGYSLNVKYYYVCE